MMFSEYLNEYGAVTQRDGRWCVYRKIDFVGKSMVGECVSEGVDLSSKEDALAYLAKCTVEKKKAAGSTF